MEPFYVRFHLPPVNDELLCGEVVCGPFGFYSGVLPLDNALNVIDQASNFVSVKVSVGRRVVNLRIKELAAAADRFFLLLVRAFEGLCPVVAVSFARALGTVAAFEGLAGFGKYPMPDRISR